MRKAFIEALSVVLGKNTTTVFWGYSSFVNRSNATNQFMKKLIFLAVLVLPFVMLLDSCKYDVEEELYPSVADSTRATYVADIAPIINTNCAYTGCHVSGAQPPSLETYTEVLSIANNGLLTARTIDQRDMPPTGPLSESDRNRIENWISNGTIEQ